MIIVDDSQQKWNRSFCRIMYKRTNDVSSIYKSRTGFSIVNVCCCLIYLFSFNVLYIFQAFCILVWMVYIIYVILGPLKTSYVVVTLFIVEGLTLINVIYTKFPWFYITKYSVLNKMIPFSNKKSVAATTFSCKVNWSSITHRKSHVSARALIH